MKEEILANEKSWGAIAHVAALIGLAMPFGNVIGPLIVWQLKKDESEFVKEHGKESLNFQLTLSIITFVIMIIALAGILFTFVMPAIQYGEPSPESIPGFLLIIFSFAGFFALLFLFNLVCIIVAAIKAGDGDLYSYPFRIKFIK